MMTLPNHTFLITYPVVKQHVTITLFGLISDSILMFVHSAEIHDFLFVFLSTNIYFLMISLGYESGSGFAGCF